MDGNQNIDNLFKDAFSKHSVPPPSGLWGKIEHELPLTTTDSAFKEAFESYEVEPAPKVWSNIRKELPLSLVVRNHLNWLSRVAAVLVVGMLLYLFTQDNGVIPTTTDIAETNQFEQEVTLGDVEQQLADTQSEQEFLFEEQAAAEQTVDNQYETPVVEKELIADNSFVDQPGNTAKNGVVRVTNIKKSKYDDAVANINIEAIAESENIGNNRLTSEELFHLEQKNNARFASLKEEKKAIEDSIRIEQKKTLESLRPKGVKFEDMYEITAPIASMPDFMEEEEESTSKAVEIPAHLMYHSLNGQPDPSMTNGKKVKKVKRKKN